MDIIGINSGLAGGNGKLYGIPYNADSVLIVDPTKGTTDHTMRNLEKAAPYPL